MHPSSIKQWTSLPHIQTFLEATNSSALFTMLKSALEEVWLILQKRNKSWSFWILQQKQQENPLQRISTRVFIEVLMVLEDGRILLKEKKSLERSRIPLKRLSERQEQMEKPLPMSLRRQMRAGDSCARLRISANFLAEPLQMKGSIIRNCRLYSTIRPILKIS